MANKNLFNSIKLTKPKKNVFDLTHDVKLSLDMGDLVPIMCLETIPGDKFNISCESLLRFSPLVAPVMHRFDVTMHYFFVPNRLVWDGWEDFITGKDDASAFPFIEVGPSDALTDKVLDYFGIPVNDVGTEIEKINALPLAAYQCIYNEYYRDQNLVDEVDFKLLNGDNSAKAIYRQIRKRAWEHDYFTSALPFAQKGAPVDIPLGDVKLKDDWENEGQGSGVYPHWQLSGGGIPGAGQGAVEIGSGTLPSPVTYTQAEGSPGVPMAYDPDGSLEVSSTTVNDLRRAFKLQEWLEKAARAGSRYTEAILAHFGVKSSDARLQRPEYITGTKSPVVISEVLNTTGTTDAPQGNMAGHAVSVTGGQYGSYYCEEHGYIIGIMSVMPKTAYQQGIPKHFLKGVDNDPFQYYWPEFANIGEQEVKKKELYAFHLQGEETFGYVPRYAEYKYETNRVAGDFRTTLDFWHEGRKFSDIPSLNQQFVECTPSDRIFAVTDETVDKLYCQVLNKVKAIRPMPQFGTPQF